MLLKIWVNNYFFINNIIKNIVLAIVGNKDDMYENEEVDEEEAKDLATELDAIFQKTSAKESHGVDDLFIKIGKRFINLKDDGCNITQKSLDNKSTKLTKISGNKAKKRCC